MTDWTGAGEGAASGRGSGEGGGECFRFVGLGVGSCACHGRSDLTGDMCEPDWPYL